METDVRGQSEIWIVLRRANVEENIGVDGMARYHIQGIATTEQVAIAMCRDSSYYIGPLPVNVSLPHERVEWPGLYCPQATELV